MGHAVLLGDSILDNGAYVAGGSPIVDQLRSRLPRDWRVTLLACDGAAVEDVARQLQKLPADASHLIVSAGGNNALESMPILNSPANEVSDFLEDLVVMQSEFRTHYRQMLRVLRDTGRPVIGCTIYDAVPGLRSVEKMALSLFNDVILRQLIASHISVLDLRAVCADAADYSSVSPIEPSEIGGSKIARALQSILVSHDFSRIETIAYP